MKSYMDYIEYLKGMYTFHWLVYIELRVDR